MIPNVAFALSLSLLHAALYVACIYAAVAIRPVAGGRDSPQVISRRMRGAAFATLTALLVTGSILCRWYPSLSWAAQMGLRPHAALGSSAIALVLTCILYLGPLAVDHLDGAFGWDRLRLSLTQAVRDPVCWRNYVVGPGTEELVFRSAVVPLWIAAGVSPTACVLASPLVFAVAHVHHAVAMYWNGEKWAAAVVRMLVQLAYTEVFGCYAAALFLRTGSVAGPVVAHIVCNVMGLPDIQRIREHEYKYALWVAHVVGLLGMVLLFEPMTRPGLFVK
ncbi:CAAX prenyl protease [Coemansia sp. S146]|nr:CAAX prenyl protease [Coemansia sp. S146]